MFDECIGWLYKNGVNVWFFMEFDLGFWCVGSVVGLMGWDLSLDWEEWIIDFCLLMVVGGERMFWIIGLIYILWVVVVYYGRYENGYYVCFWKYFKLLLLLVVVLEVGGVMDELFKFVLEKDMFVDVFLILVICGILEEDLEEE